MVEPDWQEIERRARALSTEELLGYLRFVESMKPTNAVTPQTDRVCHIYEQILWERAPTPTTVH